MNLNDMPRKRRVATLNRLRKKKKNVPLKLTDAFTEYRKDKRKKELLEKMVKNEKKAKNTADTEIVNGVDNNQDAQPTCD